MTRRLLATALAALLAALLPLNAAAGCSRDIAVPVAASGSGVIVEGQQIKGIFPDLLREMSRKTGCKFVFTVVPRARLVALYRIGRADILMPATRTPERDQLGTFVPLVNNRPMLVSIAGDRAPIANAGELLARRGLRVAVVRGFDYGEEYTALVNELGKQGRLFSEVDTTAVARLLHAGAVDLTILGPTLIAGAIRGEPRVQGMAERLRVEAIPELPWKHSGAYISHALGKDDQRTLHEALEKMAKSNQVMDAYLRYFSAELLNGNVRAR
ncbi:amino acid ABC transporter substrate-binding protein, PAAT family [Duganella sp. CF517]|uniref:substrate-binding periplasmic protein n=1 Tax=Duganella sp. CF517 TaxID=1881038 RepID=UPI0008D55FE3|nr:transporter substrate-binding domain-containing protein [Duganella sp. CF517]SEO07470.1 amino acid ABC transporter substrate-binding protein, PAAT family [Duganella sp. CF517]